MAVSKRRKSKPATVGPTPERRQHGKIVVVPGLTGKAHRVELAELFDVYLRQRKITPDEHNALEQFASTYRRGYGSDCQIARYDKGIGGGPSEAPQYAVARIRQLAMHMGPHYRWIHGVCIDGERMRPLERKMGVRNGEGFPRLKGAIRIMTDFWGLPNDGS